MQGLFLFGLTHTTIFKLAKTLNMKLSEIIDEVDVAVVDFGED
jgi:hypothetical protein